VRNNLTNITEVFDGEPVDNLLILSGQALYSMVRRVAAGPCCHRQTWKYLATQACTRLLRICPEPVAACVLGWSPEGHRRCA
jgi:hypothetical protein